MRIDNRTLVLVADGQSATFFRNTGSGEVITLDPVHTMGLFNEADRDLSADRPGHASVGMSDRRTSYEHHDRHEANETAFLKGVAGIADQFMADHDNMVLIAAPRALGVLREALSSSVMDKVSTQMDKDYTKTALPELEALLRLA